MNTYRKSLVIQLLMFIVFFVMGASVILQYYVAETFSAYSYIVLGVLVGFGVLGFIIYKKSSDEIAVITPKEFKTLKTLLYIYLFIYVGEMLLSGMESMPQDLVAIILGSALCIVASVGVFIQYNILKQKSRH